MERIRGTIVGSNFVISAGGRAVEGTEQVHTSPVVEMVWNADDLNDIVDGITEEHGQDGKHTSALVTTLKATGAEINTGTEDAKIVTPKALADSDYAKTTDVSVTTKGDLQTYSTVPDRLPVGGNGQILSANSSKDTGLEWVTPSSGGSTNLFQQAIINGNFDVWQRNTTIAMTTANAYTADRWYCETATAGTDKTVSREDGTGVNGSYYCARVKMVSDVDELLTFSQALESQDSIKFRGKKLTLSFYARGGAEFVADNSTLVSKIVTGKGTDQKVLAFTASADGVSQNNTLTTSWQKFTCTTTAAIASDITQIGVSFAFTHAGSGTTTNYFEITQVQLCAGDVALPFMPKSFQEELMLCCRYYEKSYGYGLVPGANSNDGSFATPAVTNDRLAGFKFTVRKRSSTPTVIIYSNLGTINKVANIAGTDIGSNASYDQRGQTGIRMVYDSGSPYTVGTTYVYQWTAEAEL
jgi:hypothetical protein